jgi:hypothetical protein
VPTIATAPRFAAPMAASNCGTNGRRRARDDKDAKPREDERPQRMRRDAMRGGAASGGRHVGRARFCTSSIRSSRAALGL